MHALFLNISHAHSTLKHPRILKHPHTPTYSHILTHPRTLKYLHTFTHTYPHIFKHSHALTHTLTYPHILKHSHTLTHTLTYTYQSRLHCKIHPVEVQEAEFFSFLTHTCLQRLCFLSDLLQQQHGQLAQVSLEHSAAVYVCVIMGLFS
jgi:hypothetical protein